MASLALLITRVEDKDSIFAMNKMIANCHDSSKALDKFILIISKNLKRIIIGFALVSFHLIKTLVEV